MPRLGRHVVRLVVLEVSARGYAWVIGAGIISGLGLFHVTPLSWALDVPPGGRRISLSRR
jgi:hypothetical protein